jgi:heme-degrading monooxygenase HmoA
MKFAQTPKPPYYAVIFTAKYSSDISGYRNMSERMRELAEKQPGYLGIESVEDADGFKITVSYWDSDEAICNWKAQLEHQIAQKQGKRMWFDEYEIRVAKVERAYNKKTSTL